MQFKFGNTFVRAFINSSKSTSLGYGTLLQILIDLNNANVAKFGQKQIGKTMSDWKRNLDKKMDRPKNGV